MPAPPDDDFDFATMLQEFGLGATNRHATQAMRELVERCLAVGKKGSMTVKFSVAAQDGIAALSAEIKVTKPGPTLPGGQYYTTDSFGLIEEDPRQQKMPIVSLPPTRTIPFDPSGGKGGAS